MSVRNCKEMGTNLQKIMKRLLANQNLLKLLYHTDKDPLSHKDLTRDQIREEVYEKLVKVVPRVGPKETAQSVVVIKVAGGEKNIDNDEFRDISIELEVFTPLTQWIMKDENLRPFLVLGELQESLNNKTIDGLGKMIGGDFELNFLTEELSCYTQSYKITAYD